MGAGHRPAQCRAHRVDRRPGGPDRPGGVAARDAHGVQGGHVAHAVCADPLLRHEHRTLDFEHRTLGVQRTGAGGHDAAGQDAPDRLTSEMGA